MAKVIDNSKLEVVDTIDRRKNKRYYPNDMRVKVSSDTEGGYFVVDDISIEGIRVVLKNDEVPFFKGEGVVVIIPNYDEKISAEVHALNGNLLSIKFKRNPQLLEFLERTLSSSQIFA